MFFFFILSIHVSRTKSPSKTLKAHKCFLPPSSPRNPLSQLPRHAPHDPKQTHKTFKATTRSHGAAANPPVNLHAAFPPPENSARLLPPQVFPTRERRQPIAAEPPPASKSGSPRWNESKSALHRPAPWPSRPNSQMKRRAQLPDTRCGRNSFTTGRMTEIPETAILKVRR